MVILFLAQSTYITSRMWQKDPLNREPRDFHKNPDNYSLADAPHFVFGPEFCGSRLKAFSAITDEERI